MARVLPFNAIRPTGERAQEIAALPYDVYNRKEAKEEVEDKPLSFLRIDRAEVNFPDTVDTYDSVVYEKARDLFRKMLDEGHFVQDEGPYYYLYELTMNGRVQTGVVALCSIDDYDTGVIKRHENTRRQKEEDRVRHVDTMNAQTGPIFLTYRKNEDISNLTEAVKSREDIFDFTSEDGVRHRVFIIHDSSEIEKLKKAFSQIDKIYIADGHHRCASAVRVGKIRRERIGKSGLESDFFLSVLFPDEELAIMDYNRVVRDLNGHDKEELLALIEEVAYVVPIPYGAHPEDKGSFSMYLEGQWYMCAFKDEVKNDDPVKGLDVALLQDLVLEPIFGIEDPKTDERIDFVGGIRGLSELERRVSTDMKVAFAMYPTSVSELMRVADAGLLMPPKSTWFEPKLRSGLFIHDIT